MGPELRNLESTVPETSSKCKVHLDEIIKQLNELERAGLYRNQEAAENAAANVIGQLAYLIPCVERERKK